MDLKPNEIFSNRQIFGFFIPGVLLLVGFIWIDYLLSPVPFFCIIVTFYTSYKEIALIIGAILFIIISFLLGLINVHISSFILNRFVNKFVIPIASLSENQKNEYKKIDNKILRLDTVTVLKSLGYNKKNSDIYEIFSFSKFYVVHNSERLGKILLEIEAEVNLFQGLIIPALMLFAITSLLLKTNDCIIKLGFYILFVLIVFFLLFKNRIPNPIVKNILLVILFIVTILFIILLFGSNLYFIFLLSFLSIATLYISLQRYIDGLINEINSSIDFLFIVAQDKIK